MLSRECTNSTHKEVFRKNWYTTMNKYRYIYIYGFPGGTIGKELTCQCKRCKRHGVQYLGREDPLEKGVAIHSSILAMDRNLVGYSPQGCKESDVTEVTKRARAHTHTHTHTHIYTRNLNLYHLYLPTIYQVPLDSM